MFRAREYVASLRQMLGRPASPDATCRPKKGRQTLDAARPLSLGLDRDTSLVQEGGVQGAEEREGVATPKNLCAGQSLSSSCSASVEIDSSLHSHSLHGINKHDIDLQTISTRGSDTSCGSGARNNRSGGKQIIRRFITLIIRN